MSRGRDQQARRPMSMVLLLGTGLLGLLAAGCLTDSSRVPRVGILAGSEAFLEIAAGFKKGMGELGYEEGREVIYTLRKSNADPVMEEQGARQLVAEKVDLILAFPTETALFAREAARDTNIPVVFAYAGIEGADLVESVRRPSGNITGVRFPGPEQISRRLELLLEFAPWVRRVWIGYHRNYPNTGPALAALHSLAESRQVSLIEVPADTVRDFETDLDMRSHKEAIGIDSFLLMPDVLNHSPAGWQLISRFADEHHIPIAGSFLYTVEQGAVFGNANNLSDVGKLAASLAVRVLRGIPAGTIPVVTPEQDLWINYRRARELGLTVPLGMLKMARKVIH